MSFTYDPNDAVSVWPEGEYQGHIEKVEERESKAGNPMLVVTFRVYRGDQEMLINDYIVNPATLFKLKNIAKALDRETEFKAGKFDIEKHIGAGFTLTLGVQVSDKYDDSNTIKKYAAKSGGSTRPAPSRATVKASTAPLTDDDIPFD